MKIQKLIEQRNIETRRIYVWDEITDDIAGGILERIDIFLSRNREPIWFLINSCGGSVNAASAMADEMDALQEQGVIVNTCAVGSAYSAAAFLLAKGTPGHRYVRPSAGVMLHPVSFSLSHDYAEFQERATAFMRKETRKMNKSLAEACGKGGKQFSRFLKDISKGLWLDAEQAIAYGVADKIWRGALPLDEKTSNERRVSESPPKSGQQKHHALSESELRNRDSL